MAVEGTDQTEVEVEEKLTLDIDTIPDPVLIADYAQKQIVTANEAAGDLFECSPDTLTGMTLEDVHPIDTEVDAANYIEAFERGRNSKRVNRLQTGEPIYIETLDGALKPIEINAQRLSTADGEHILGIFRDVTEQHTREQELQSTTNRSDGIVTQWNQAAEELYGYSADDVVGEPYPLFPDEFERENLVERVTNGEMLDGYETLHRTKDGSHVHLELYLRPLYDDGRISGIIGAGVDITDRRRRVQQLDVLHRTLRHNIRNQLNVIQGHLEQLDDQLDTGNGSIETAASATEEMLARAEIAQQIGVGSQQNELTRHSLPELVAAAVEQYRDVKGMFLQTDVEDVSVRTVKGFKTAIEPEPDREGDKRREDPCEKPEIDADKNVSSLCRGHCALRVADGV